MEEELKAALSERHKADQTKLDFLAIMNHELRTPLNAIMGFAELLQDHLARGTGGGQLAEYAELIRASGAKLLTMVTNILEFARMPAPHEGRVFVKLDVGDVVRSATLIPG